MFLRPYLLTGAKVAPTNFARSPGANVTWCPTFPAETVISRNSCAVASITVGNRFFIPMGEQPP